MLQLEQSSWTKANKIAAWVRKHTSHSRVSWHHWNDKKKMCNMKWSEYEMFLYVHFFTHSQSIVCLVVNGRKSKKEGERDRYERARSHTQHITQANFFPLSFNSFRSSIVLCESHIQHKTAVCSNRKKKHSSSSNNNDGLSVYTCYIGTERQSESRNKSRCSSQRRQSVALCWRERNVCLFARLLACSPSFEYDNDDRKIKRINRLNWEKSFCECGQKKTSNFIRFFLHFCHGTLLFYCVCVQCVWLKKV